MRHGLEDCSRHIGRMVGHTARVGTLLSAVGQMNQCVGVAHILQEHLPRTVVRGVLDRSPDRIDLVEGSPAEDSPATGTGCMDQTL